MPRFSERIGKKDVPQFLETESMSLPLRNSLWNYMILMVDGSRHTDWSDFAKALAQHFRRSPVDELPSYEGQCRNWVKEYFYELSWHEAFDLVEFFADNIERLFSNDRGRSSTRSRDVINTILESEHSGYRFVGGVLVAISNPTELAEVSGALETTSIHALLGAHTHIDAALQLFSKRPEPDYRNSVKEAISAVESLAKQLGGSNAQGLSGALTALSEKAAIHGALRSAFVKLYGYTSDEDGVRHAILEEPNVGFDEAKYMIVACSAFVNYLAAKAKTAGIL